MLTRRKLLGNTLMCSAGLALARNAYGFADVDAKLTLRLSKVEPVQVPANFTGLGYEMSSVAPLGLLSASNHRYVELIKGLGPEGVLRVGGIVANYTRYEPNGTIIAERQNTVITRASLGQFCGFLKKTGWRTIWSVNFAQSSIQDAVEEARAVAHVLGPRLLALEVGNEVDGYENDYETYRTEYNEWYAAIVKAVPGMPFAAPDTAVNVEWVERMAEDAAGDVQLLTTHYYRTGQDHGSFEQLLQPDPRLMDTLVRLHAASRRSGIPWRMCETNSFSGGGLRGVSDTFIGALWTLDYMLLLAEYGCSGVNIETGVNQLGFISPYSPIQDDGKGANSAGIPYYGMLAFAVARRGCTEARVVDVPEPAGNITAYALGTAGNVHSVVIVNRGVNDVRISVENLSLDRRLTAMRLLAPSGNSTTGVTFAGASVEASGKWSPAHIERVIDSDVALPRMSAVVLRNS